MEDSERWRIVRGEWRSGNCLNSIRSGIMTVVQMLES